MTAPHADKIVAAYLSRLDHALSSLPTARRREMLTEIREHIADARGAVAVESDAEVRAILERVGVPADIAEEARARLGIPVRRVGPAERAALLLIGLGGSGFLAPILFPLFPLLRTGGLYSFALWVVGVAMVRRSPCWTVREKRLAAYLPLVVGFAAAVAASRNRQLDGAAFLGVTVLPVTSAAFLIVRAGSWSLVAGRAVTALAAAVVGLVAVAAVSVVVPRSHGFLTSAEASPLAPAGTRCGGFYGTTEYGLGLPARAYVSVGVCLDGSRVRRTWGKPDCWTSESGLAYVSFPLPPCEVKTTADGSMTVTMHSIGGPAWWPDERQIDASWRIRPDGSVRQLSG